MRAWDELVERCAAKRAESLGGLSDQAYQELVHAVRKDPERFVDDAAEEAFLALARALDAFDADVLDDDLLDDDEFLAKRATRMSGLAAACEQTLAIDPDCLDARLLHALAGFDDINALYAELAELSDRAPGRAGDGDAWADPFSRPVLRLRAALSRSCLDTGRFSRARALCEALMEDAPGDEPGAGLTLALVLARMEDEDALDALDRRQGRRGNAWMHLARTLLLYKLDRMDAASRALVGFRSMCAGGAYILLRPYYVDIYMPDRPQFMPGSLEETTLAVHEGDPVIMDTPDFIGWAAEQPGTAEDARLFAEREGLDW